jgi:hypothetical protein
MGVVGAVADDQEAEYIRNVCENEIVTGKSLLAALRYVSTPFLKSPSVLPCHIKYFLVIQMTYFVKTPMNIWCEYCEWCEIF